MHLFPQAAVEARESEYFSAYVNDLMASHPGVSHFDLNLETWRQLWRVTEMADVLLLVVDCRYPKAMVPPSLHDHVRAMGKDMIIVLNKVDLVPVTLALAWEDFFKER